MMFRISPKIASVIEIDFHVNVGEKLHLRERFGFL